MSAPEQVRLKRKRTEDPPQLLVLSRSIDLADHHDTKRVRYILKEADTSTTTKAAALPHDREPSTTVAQDGKPHADAPLKPSQGHMVTTDARPTIEPIVSRKFHLKRARAPSVDDSSHKRSRGNSAFQVPVFEETIHGASRNTGYGNKPSSPKVDTSPQPTKRPGRGAAIRTRERPDSQNSRSKTNADMQALADSMHQFALDELSKIPKPTTKTRPRMSPAQSKSRHACLVASKPTSPMSSTASDAMDVDEADFVYDTYILAEGVEIGPEDDVGLLVIHEDDEEYWRSLIEDVEEPNDLDEEDENAEDHYAADYPEDELASDDEYDHNAYSFRPRANSDVEQWDHRNESDDENESDFNQISMQSQTLRKWEQELGFKPLHSND